MDVLSALRAIPALAWLPPESLQRIASFCSVRTVRAGETVFCQGEPSPYCFGVLSGEVTIYRVARDRDLPAKALGVLGPGSLFGESALCDDSPRAAMASVTAAGELLVISGSALREWAKNTAPEGTTVILSMLQTAYTRLRTTAIELTLLDGLNKLLSAPMLGHARLMQGMRFIVSSIDGLQMAALYQLASDGSFQPVAVASTMDGVRPVPASHELAAHARQESNAHPLPHGLWQSALAELKLPCTPLSNAAFASLRDPQGFLLVAGAPFSPAVPRLLASMALPLAKELART